MMHEQKWNFPQPHILPTQAELSGNCSPPYLRGGHGPITDATCVTLTFQLANVHDLYRSCELNMCVCACLDVQPSQWAIEHKLLIEAGIFQTAAVIQKGMTGAIRRSFAATQGVLPLLLGEFVFDIAAVALGKQLQCGRGRAKESTEVDVFGAEEAWKKKWTGLKPGSRTSHRLDPCHDVAKQKDECHGQSGY
eukprot:scaffold200673_cov21-Tisochrysis_lutea.AAC.2